MIENDIIHVIELITRNWDEVLIHHHSIETVQKFRAEETGETFKKHLSSKELYVVEDNGQVMATGSLVNYGTAESPRLCVSMFFVSPDYHSKGIGRMLLEHLFSSVALQHAEKLHVPSSRNAINFYKRFGFVVDASQPDESIEITWMTKEM